MHPLLRLLAALLILAPAAARAEAPTIAPGEYDEMLIGFDPATQVVTGDFSSETGAGQFTCIFYLSGKLQGPKAAITTYYAPDRTDDVIKGTLTVEGRNQFLVQLPQEHGGCWNVEHFADKDQPADFTLSKAHPWTAIAVVKSKTAYFYDSPASPTHRKGYVTTGDAVGVRAVQDGRLQVDFVGDGSSRMVSGWLRQADVYPGD